MEYKKFGSTGLVVSEICFGCWAIGGHGYGVIDDNESIAAIRKALDLGINFFDTADTYGFGHSEEVLEKALGARKKDVIIATKFGVAWNEAGKTYKDCSPERVLKSLDASLKRLKIDCIPIYQIHWHDDKTPIKDTIETLKACQKAGKIRHISCSNFSMPLICEAHRYQRVESLQCLYNVFQRDNEKDMMECAEQFGMGVIAYGTIVRGLLSGKYGPASCHFGKNDTRISHDMFKVGKLERNIKMVEKLKAIGERYGKTSAQAAIRFVLDKPFVTCALVGHKTARQVEENANSVGWNLTSEDIEEINVCFKELGYD